MSTLQINAQGIKDNASNKLGFLDGKYLEDKFTQYVRENGVGEQLNLLGVNDTELRSYLEYAISHKYRNQLHQYFHSESLIELLSMFGAVKSTTMAHRVGHFISKQFSTSFKATAPIGAGAGQPQLLTLEPDYCIGTTISALDIDSVIVYGETQIQGLVIGIDTGDSRLRVNGVTNTGIPVTAGSMGGTPTAHVVCVIPMQNIVLPAVTADTALFVLSSNSIEGSCPNNSMLSKFDDEFIFGSSVIRSDIRNTGHSNSTGIAERTFGDGVKNIKVVADIAYFNMRVKHIYKIVSEIIFGQQATNPNALMIDGELKANNGFYTSAIANGGFFSTYVPGSITFASQVENMFDFMSQGGINEAMMLSSYQQYKEIQRVIPEFMWKDNIQFSPTNVSMMNPYQNDYCFSGMSFNFTTSCIEFGGKRIWLKQLPYLSDNNTYGNAYAHTGMLIPMKTYSVKDTLTGVSREAFAVNVYFQKDKYGRVRDDKHMLVNGGASDKYNSNCDIEDISFLTQLNTETVGSKNIMILQGADPTFSLT
jgi:hypothetical protein